MAYCCFILIARHPVLANAHNCALLPASWTTLAQLSRVEPEQLGAAVANNWLRADLRGKDVPKLLERIRQSSGRRRSPKKAAPKRFFSETRRFFDDETVAWLDGLDPHHQRDLIEQIVALIRGEKPDG